MQKTTFVHLSDMRRLYCETYGSGSPTVVIEVGSTMPGTRDPGWFAIRDHLAECGTVLLYDRANLGQSDPLPLPRRLDDFTSDLHAALTASAVPEPYVLVGCSLGGMIVAQYASQHPDRIRGMLLLDPPHPRIHAGTLTLLPPHNPEEPPSLTEFRQQTWTEQYDPQHCEDSEGMDYADAIEQAKKWDLRDIPLIVMTAGMNEYGEGFPVAVAQAYEAIWLDLNRQYAALSTRSEHLLVADSDHVIHDNKPELVIEAIERLRDVT